MGEFAEAVKNGIDNSFIEWADSFGMNIAQSVSTSQIRNIYGTVKKLEMASELNEPELLLLKPRISYATQRNKSLRDLSKQLTSAIDAVVDTGVSAKQKEVRFRRFCQGFEAILAYHRAHGGK